jgi:hypothetical protein
VSVSEGPISVPLAHILSPLFPFYFWCCGKPAHFGVDPDEDPIFQFDTVSGSSRVKVK